MDCKKQDDCGKQDDEREQRMEEYRKVNVRCNISTEEQEQNAVLSVPMSTCIKEVKRVATQLYPLPKGYTYHVIASCGGGRVLWLKPMNYWIELDEE